MNIDKKELTLPEWAFLDAHSHLGNDLEGRTVILHIRSATVIEIIACKDFVPKKNIMRHDFEYNTEKLCAVVHYCATLSVNLDREYIIEKILIPCADWYIKCSEWEDKGIVDDITAAMN